MIGAGLGARRPPAVARSGGRWSRQETVILAALLLAVVGTRMVFLAANPFTLYAASDEHGYLLIARDLGGWWSDGNAVRGPLYPALLWLVGSDVRAAEAVNVVMECGALATLFATVWWRWGRLAASVAGVGWVLYGPFAYHDYTLIPEMANVLLVTTFASACLVQWLDPARGWRWSVAAGISLGLLELLRPGAGRAIGPVLLLVALRAPGVRAGLQRTAVAIAVGALVITPWLVRNDRLYGQPLLSTVRSYGLLTGIPPRRFVVPPPPLAGFGLAGTRPGGLVDNRSRATFFSRRDALYDREDARTIDTWLHRYGRRYAGTMIGEHVQRPGTLWLGSALAVDQVAGFRVLRGDALRGPFHVLHVAVVLLALLSLVAIRRLARDTLPWLTVLGLVTAVTVLFVQPQARYALSYVPIMLALLGVGAASAVARRTGPTPPGAADPRPAQPLG